MMEKNFSLSVVLITYNQEKTIEKAIVGILNQKITEKYELIIADDASTDKTIEIIEKYEKQYPSVIKKIKKEKNTGGGLLWIEAFEKCCGEYIAYCEGDDYWINEYKLKIQYEYMLEDDGVDLTWTDINVYNEYNDEFILNAFENNYFSKITSPEEYLLNKRFCAPSTWMLRRRVVPFMREAVEKKYVDGTFPLILDILHTGNIKYINTVTTVYRVHENSQTNTKNKYKRYLFAKGVFETQLEYIRKYSYGKDVRKKVINQALLKLTPMAIIHNDYLFLQRIQKLTNSLFFKILIKLIDNAIGKNLLLLAYKIKSNLK
jgi:glucosyltransferase